MLKTKTRKTSKKNLFLRGRYALYASSNQMQQKVLLALASCYGIFSYLTLETNNSMVSLLLIF